MRDTFIQTLVECARADERIWLLVGDLGYSVVEPFIQEFPDRFINAGVAEQNMTGIAAGLALSGKVVFTYSIANFPTLRCLEQIRNDVCYHNANVKVVAVGGGFAYGSQGMTHHATEDIAIMKALPNMTVVAPGDPAETALAVRALIKHSGPCYLRLGRGKDPVVHEVFPDFHIGKAITVRIGHDVTFIATGGILYNAVQAADRLKQQGIQVCVLSMHTVKPLDENMVSEIARNNSPVITIEEHGSVGGLGSAVADVLVKMGNKTPPFRKLSTGDSFLHTVGNQEYLRHACGLSVDDICKAAYDVLGRDC